MSAERTDANAAARDARLAPWFWASVCALVAGFWIAPAIPTQDGPIHLYNLGLIADLLAGHPERSAVFQLEFAAITNLGFVTTGLALAQWMPLWAVERFVLCLHVVLLAGFATRWLRVTGRSVYPAAWVALAFALPWSLFMGFYGFQLGSDLALLGMTLAWSRRDQGLGRLSGLMLACGALVLFFHAIAAALFAGLLGLMQLVASDRPRAERALRACGVALPTVCLTLVALVGSESDTAWVWREWRYVFVYLVTLGNFTFGPHLTTLLLITAGWVLLCLPGAATRQSDTAHRFALAAGIAVAGLHMVLPDVVGGGGYLTGRFAWWIPLLMLPLVDTEPTRMGRIKRRALPQALAFISIASTFFVAMPSAKQVAEVTRAATLHPISGRLTAAIFDRDPRSKANLEPLRHVAAWFVVDGGLLTSNYQARVPFFPVRLAPATRAHWPHVDINAAWETDWSRLPIDALLAIDARPDDRVALSRRFESVWTGDGKRVELWRRRQEPDARP